MSNKGKHSKKIKFSMKTGSVSIALSALLCVAVGLGIYSMNGAQIPQTPNSSATVESTQGSSGDALANSDAASTVQPAEGTDVAAPDGSAEAELAESNPATNYSAVPEDAYVADTVLVMVDGMQDAQAKLTQLSELGYAADASLDEESVNAGFIEVTLAEGANPGVASDALCAQGIITQPNFVYHLLDEEDDAKAEASETTASAASEANRASEVSESPQAESNATASAGDSESLELQAAAEPNETTADALAAANASEGAKASNEAPLTAQQATSTDDPRANQNEDWLTMVNAYDAWDLATTDQKVTVAVIDSGCNMNHEDLKNNIVGSYNTSTGGKVTNDDHASSHGTHVAGIIAAEANNGKGIAGVSYNAGLYIVHALHNNQALSSDVIKAYQNIIDNREKTVDNHKMNIRVINMSLGVSRTGTLGSDDTAVMEKINDAYSSCGILTVVAAGNDSNGSAYRCYPCDFSDSVLGVINLHRSGTDIVRYTSSNFNRSNTRLKDLGAPGTEILSTTSVKSGVSMYGSVTGTSMSAPVAAGIAALVLSVNNNLTPAQVTSILCSSATDIGDAGFDNYTGYGCVNAKRAVELAKASAYIDGADSLLKGSTIKLSCSGVTKWNSDNTSVASVSNNGTVTGKNGGFATITATTPNGDIKKTVTVYSNSVTGSASVTSGKQSSYYVTGTPESVWTFSSSDASVATITSTGTLTAQSAGTTTVTATLSSNSNVKVSQQVTVKAASSNSGSGSSGSSGGSSSGSGGSGSGSGGVSMQRLYNPNSGEHFYTADTAERDKLTGVGWSYEGIGWTAPSTSSTPVYRLYNANGGEHHYTTSTSEKDMLVSVGWSYEGIGWYSDDSKRVALYRDYNPNAFANNHNYTTSVSEHNMLMGVGWQSEGYAWYGM